MPGYRVEAITPDGPDLLHVDVRGTRPGRHCPHCGRASRAVHSRYRRQPADLPSLGRRVRVGLRVRRFYCRNAMALIETPANPPNTVVDIPMLRQVAEEIGRRPGHTPVFACDNTMLGPVFQLREHPKVTKVHHLPFKPPNSAAARIYAAQSTGAGSTLSFDISGGQAAAFRFLNTLQIFKLAVSLGGTESPASLPASMTYSGMPVQVRERMGILESTIRLSIGIERPDDLVAAPQSGGCRTRSEPPCLTCNACSGCAARLRHRLPATPGPSGRNWLCSTATWMRCVASTPTPADRVSGLSAGS